ncbi:MAG: type II secretion system protein GspL [Planctomycetota bacterium]|jgi:type IV pilus assembly protein PilM
MAKAVGLDAGEYEVKVVELDGSYRKPRLAKVNIERIAQESASAADEQHATTEAESVRQVLKDAAVSKEGVNLGFPCREAVLRTINVPFTGTDKIRKVIKFEAEGEIHSHNVDDMVVDFHTIEEQENETRVLVAAVPKHGLRTTLEALQKVSIEPETVDLDTMALFRVAEWAGLFRTNGEESENEDLVFGQGTPRARLVLDLGARSSRVLIVVGGHLTDMRALRSGADSVAQEIAAAKGLDLETARDAVLHCLTAGTDFQMGPGADVAMEDEVVLADEEMWAAAESTPKPTGESTDESTDESADESTGESTGESTALALPTLISHESVVLARDRYLQKLHRELMRFLTSVSNMGQIDQVWITGGGSLLPGVEEVLQGVFGCRPKALAFLDQLQHSLSEDEARRLEPRLAVAFGLALGRLGGAQGFNFRQEDLVFTRRFDRIKLPLAIACMLGLFFLCFFGLKLRKELTNLERQFGVTVPQKKTASKRATGRSGGRVPQASLPRFTGYLGKLVNINSERGMWARRYLGDKEYPRLLRQLADKPVFERIRHYHTYLTGLNKRLASGAGQIAGYELDSGCAVLQELAEVIEKNKESLGRILVCELDMRIPSQKRGRTLALRVAFRGNDFRTRQANLQAAFDEQMKDKGR